ncbi:hypothetical protein HRG_012526 [Hirsutella rhossiliensis]
MLTNSRTRRSLQIAHRWGSGDVSIVIAASYFHRAYFPFKLHPRLVALKPSTGFGPMLCGKLYAIFPCMLTAGGSTAQKTTRVDRGFSFKPSPKPEVSDLPARMARSAYQQRQPSRAALLTDHCLTVSYENMKSGGLSRIHPTCNQLTRDDWLDPRTLEHSSKVSRSSTTGSISEAKPPCSPTWQTHNRLGLTSIDARWAARGHGISSAAPLDLTPGHPVDRHRVKGSFREGPTGRESLMVYQRVVDTAAERDPKARQNMTAETKSAPSLQKRQAWCHILQEVNSTSQRIRSIDQSGQPAAPFARPVADPSPELLVDVSQSCHLLAGLRRNIQASGEKEGGAFAGVGREPRNVLDASRRRYWSASADSVSAARTRGVNQHENDPPWLEVRHIGRLEYNDASHDSSGGTGWLAGAINPFKPASWRVLGVPRWSHESYDGFFADEANSNRAICSANPSPRSRSESEHGLAMFLMPGNDRSQSHDDEAASQK